jgi:hypothetical protein
MGVKSFITLGTGGSMGRKYVLQLFYSEKSHKIDNNSATTEARKKLAHIWNPQNFRFFF